MNKSELKEIDKVYRQLLNNLNNKNDNKINVVVLYAYNGTGKTRLSKRFQDNNKDNTLCYNAFFEDYFYWNNDKLNLNIDINSWVFRLIKDQGLNNQIVEIFKEFVDTDIEPDININNGDVIFKKPSVEGEIKISRGEENIFRWSVFYSILKEALELLNENKEDRSTNIFDNIKYIIIDDPVSSMDDNRIITIALKISKLIKNSKDNFNFLITTHHPLFFNVLFHKKSDRWKKFNYILYKTDSEFELKKQVDEAPFSYHLTLITEINSAIETNRLRKYHFNLFRTLLEKTSNFLGYSHWKECLDGINASEDFLKIIDHYSHDKLSDFEYNSLINNQVENYKTVFNGFLSKYNFKRG